MFNYEDSQDYNEYADATSHPEGAARAVSKAGKFPGRAYWYTKDENNKFDYFRWEDPEVQAAADAEYEQSKGTSSFNEPPKKNLSSFSDLAEKVETHGGGRGRGRGRGKGRAASSRKGGNNQQKPYQSSAKIPTMSVTPSTPQQAMCASRSGLPLIELDDLLRKRLNEQTEQIKKFIVTYVDSHFKKLADDLEADGAALDDHFGWLYEHLGKDKELETQEDKDFILSDEDLNDIPTDEDLSEYEYETIKSKKKTASKAKSTPAKKRKLAPKEKKQKKKPKVESTPSNPAIAVLPVEQK